MKEVFIVGEMCCDPSKVDEVEAILNKLRKETRKEHGCIFYQYFEGEGKPGVFATIEHWENEEVEAAHWKTAHIKEATEKLGPLMKSEMKISRYNRANNETGCD